MYFEINDSLSLFTSKRKKGKGDLIHPQDNRFFEDIYTYNQHSVTQNLNILNTRTHDASLCMSYSGNTMFFYRNDNQGDIYYSNYNKTKEKWSSPKNFGEAVNTKSRESSISITADSSIVYFVSNRTDITNYGEEDIFYCTMQDDNTWSEPKNVGEIINTPYHEQSVNISPDGKIMYFCSRGHNTMGGFDVFKTTQDETGNWTKPENLGYPINSPDNDIYFNLNNDSIGFFSSVRTDGIGTLDIYKITFTQPVIPQIDTVPTKILTTYEMPEALFIFQNFTFDYNIYENTNVFNELDEFAEYLINNPKTKIKITGYTCAIGTSEYNIELSLKRANFITNYLINKGVNPDNIITQGKGEDNQIAINYNENKTRCNVSIGLNRRIEVQVLEQGGQQLIIKQIDVPKQYQLEEYVQNSNNNIYSIYLSSSQNEEDINQYADIENVISYYNNESEYYTFYVGKFNLIEQAEKTITNLKEKGYRDIFIFINENKQIK